MCSFVRGSNELGLFWDGRNPVVDEFGIADCGPVVAKDIEVVVVVVVAFDGGMVAAAVATVLGFVSGNACGVVSGASAAVADAGCGVAATAVAAVAAGPSDTRTK